MGKSLQLKIHRQPDDETCGPTCLHAVYNYYGNPITLKQVIADVPQLDTGGTITVLLAIDALRKGYKTTIYNYNLNLFDPSWFGNDQIDLKKKLISQAKQVNDSKFHLATRGYLEFLGLGGQLKFEDLTPELIEFYLLKFCPILTGLSATYLYREARTRIWDDEFDDVRGQSSGHFVVLTGMYEQKRVQIADPLHKTSGKYGGNYTVDIHRLICAILLGVLSYDGNLLVVEQNNNNCPKVNPKQH